VLIFVRNRTTTRSLAGLRSAHALQASSGAVCRQLEANGIPPGKIVRLPAYAPAPAAAKGSTGPVGRNILHVGGLLGHKGVWMIIRMLRVLPGDVQLVFAGGGREQDMLESHVRRRGLGSRVRVVGDPTLHQWGLLYREATLVVMPVLWNEPLGLDGLAALAHGKPVVAFGTDGIREWLVDGENGVCVPFGKRPAFRDAVRGLLEDGERLRGMGRRARQMWEERFRPEAHLRALVAHYEKLCREVER
jgi:glycosyltransferase involved in cell wall biosynthesis